MITAPELKKIVLENHPTWSVSITKAKSVREAYFNLFKVKIRQSKHGSWQELYASAEKIITL